MHPFTQIRLHDIVKILAVGEGNIRERLEKAAHEFFVIESQHLPEDLRKQFNWIANELTKRNYPRYDGSIESTLKKMKNKTGRRIAESIFDLYDKVTARDNIHT